MKKYIKYFTLLLFVITLSQSCNNQKGTKEAKEVKEVKETNNNTQKEVSKLTQEEIENSEGYKLMKSKCFVCHLPKPDPSKSDQMIAPPMMRVKEHYLPYYQDKESFVKAVMSIVKNPSEEKTLMPGAVKNFNLMPKLPYDDNELKMIVETVYDYDFGSMSKQQMKMHGDLKLNNGKPWKIKKETMNEIDQLTDRLYEFKSDNIKDYNQLGKDLFNDAKSIMLDKSYTGEIFNQLHAFFDGIEEDMHTLIKEKSLDKAKEEVKDLQDKFSNFYYYFEAENN